LTDKDEIHLFFLLQLFEPPRKYFENFFLFSIYIFGGSSKVRSKILDFPALM